MANHCMEVACTNCGAWYCLRGCGDATGPDEKNKAIIREKIKQESAVKHEALCCNYCHTENLYKL